MNWNPAPMFLAPLFAACSAVPAANNASALSTTALETAPPLEASPITDFTSSDGTRLALRKYETEEPRAVLIFYHGGGAHSGASYQHLATELRDDFSINVWTPDLRGHGKSDGRRGDAPSTRRVLRDVSELVAHARETFPGLPLFLGGHSSGAGLLLNAWSKADWTAPSGPISGYVMVAPQFGFRSKTERDHIERPFAEVKVGQFVLNIMTFGAACGHCYAVRFSYGEQLLARDPLLVDRNSVNMANALTPRSPRKQIRSQKGPLGIWLAENDALIAPEKVERLVKDEAPQATVTRIPGEEHLSILLSASKPIGEWLAQSVSTTSAPNAALR